MKKLSPQQLAARSLGGSKTSERKRKACAKNLAKAREAKGPRWFYVKQMTNDHQETYTSKAKPGKPLKFPSAKAVRFKSRKAANNAAQRHINRFGGYYFCP